MDHIIDLHNPTDMPDPVKINSIEEPWIKATIIVPDELFRPCIRIMYFKKRNSKKS